MGNIISKSYLKVMFTPKQDIYQHLVHLFMDVAPIRSTHRRGRRRKLEILESSWQWSKFLGAAEIQTLCWRQKSWWMLVITNYHHITIILSYYHHYYWLILTTAGLCFFLPYFFPNVAETERTPGRRTRCFCCCRSAMFSECWHEIIVCLEQRRHSRTFMCNESCTRLDKISKQVNHDKSKESLVFLFPHLPGEGC